MMNNLPYFDIFERFLDKSTSEIKSDVPETLYNAIRYSLNNGGKRIRPVLFLNTYALFKEIDSCALNFAAGIEAYHAFTLVHDDLPCMDDDDFRRGLPTSHRVFGDGQAVLSGDALVNQSYAYILKSVRECYDTNAAINAAIKFNSYVGASGLIGGQSVDIDKSLPLNEETVNYIYKHKTCDLICASMVCAAIIAGADEQTIDKIEKYAYNFGYVFQLVDDLLDAEKQTEEKTLVQLKSSEEILQIITKLVDEAILAISEVKTQNSTKFFVNLIKESVKRKF